MSWRPGPWSGDEQPSRALPGPRPDCGADRTQPGMGLCGGAPGGWVTEATEGDLGERGPFTGQTGTDPAER